MHLHRPQRRRHFLRILARRWRADLGRKLSLVAVLAAWLVATGSHWDLVQTFAWARMVISYSQDMPVTEALLLTFSGNAPCDICNVVTAGKKAQDQDPASTSGAGAIGKHADGKILLALSPAPLSAPDAPAADSWPGSVIHEPAIPAYPVPVPPPRA
ncbi:hypothetical protein OpiT1DRAFT_00246 [Opitutaceae bacterium TAV1]|nr:hypothetical protein OPIT5_26640 [Opitutaceae bacterium TAV5]EIQ01673.1 hypothetical protein OpiT1DRAFT_00246 [Opitutaceae bacterium TAV1]